MRIPSPVYLIPSLSWLEVRCALFECMCRLVKHTESLVQTHLFSSWILLSLMLFLVSKGNVSDPHTHLTWAGLGQCVCVSQTEFTVMERPPSSTAFNHSRQSTWAIAFHRGIVVSVQAGLVSFWTETSPKILESLFLDWGIGPRSALPCPHYNLSGLHSWYKMGL